LIDLAVNNNILEKSGSWFSYKGERIGQGRENARQFLKDNRDIARKIEDEVRKKLGMATPGEKTPVTMPPPTPTDGHAARVPVGAGRR